MFENWEERAVAAEEQSAVHFLARCSLSLGEAGATIANVAWVAPHEHLSDLSRPATREKELELSIATAITLLAYRPQGRVGPRSNQEWASLSYNGLRSVVGSETDARQPV